VVGYLPGIIPLFIIGWAGWKTRHIWPPGQLRERIGLAGMVVAMSWVILTALMSGVFYAFGSS
jgi:hypothetical protein